MSVREAELGELQAPICSRCGADTNTLNRGLPICVKRHLQVVGRKATPEEQSVLDRYLVANVRFIVACRDPTTPLRYGRRQEWSGMDLRKAKDMRKYVSDVLARARGFRIRGRNWAGDTRSSAPRGGYGPLRRSNQVLP